MNEWIYVHESSGKRAMGRALQLGLSPRWLATKFFSGHLVIGYYSNVLYIMPVFSSNMTFIYFCLF